MRVLVCGGRDYADDKKFSLQMDALNEQYCFTCVIQGGAPGADYFAICWGQENKLPIETYRADWHTYGKAAGPIRNKHMLREGKPDIVVAFPGGRGTSNMIKQAEEAGVRVVEIK